MIQSLDYQSIKNGKALPVVEEFYSIQGEGFHSGKPAYFIRVGGCDIACHFCDTKISWNASLHQIKSVTEIVEKVMTTSARSVVVTGGEPTMFNLKILTDLIKKNNISSFLETSGAYPVTGDWDWICVSPKPKSPPLKENLEKADELKVVIASNSDFEWAEKWVPFVNSNCKLFLQPEFSNFKTIINEIVEYCKNNPYWNISLQIQKFMDIP